VDGEAAGVGLQHLLVARIPVEHGKLMLISKKLLRLSGSMEIDPGFAKLFQGSEGGDSAINIEAWRLRPMQCA